MRFINDFDEYNNTETRTHTLQALLSTINTSTLNGVNKGLDMLEEYHNQCHFIDSCIDSLYAQYEMYVSMFNDAVNSYCDKSGTQFRTLRIHRSITYYNMCIDVINELRRVSAYICKYDTQCYSSRFNCIITPYGAYNLDGRVVEYIKVNGDRIDVVL